MSDHSGNGHPIQDGEVYDELSSIFRTEGDFTKRSSQILQLGKRLLGVDNGHITRIEPRAGLWETIGSSSPEGGDFPIGLTLNLDETYCRRTLDQRTTIALHDASAQGWGDDPAFQKHQLQTYLGTPFDVNDRTFGTVCFVANEARTRPFTQAEIAFVEFLAELVSQTFEQERQKDLIAEKERVISTLSRVLRHNLSNDLNVVYGHAEMLEAKADASLEQHILPIKRNAEDLINLARKARELQTIVNTEYHRSSVELKSLLQSATSAVQPAAPEASISIECPEDLIVDVLPILETALEELLENAVTHTVNTPEVQVVVERSRRSFAISIEDNGVGLPSSEKQVLEDGVESPLVHGSGLGLWLVHWIVDRHDGEVEASVTDTGTEIELVLPFATAKIPDDIDVPTP